MRERVPEEATCAICGRHFDPSDTRGWCPNPSCGEWQHPLFPVGKESEPTSESTETTVDTSPSTPMKQCPNCSNEVRADANFCKHCATQLTGGDLPTSEPETSEDDGAISECPDCGADLTGIPSDRLSTCPICMFDLTPVIDEADAETGGSRSESETQPPTDCPNCGENLTQIPADRRTVCPGCRVNLEDSAEAATDPAGTTGQASASGGTTNTARSRGPQSQDTAATPLDSMDDIAGGYIQRLSEIGVTTIGDLVASDADTVSAKTGISARRIRDWIDDAPISPSDVSGKSASTDDEKPSQKGSTGDSSGTEEVGTDEVDYQETRIQRSPDKLVLDVMGKQITVTDGTTVGREVRKAMVDAGAPEEDAVYVHRKHVRITADNEGFLLTRLGENGLTVNGQTVEKGTKVRIEDGDSIGFSDVVTATVSVQ